MNIFILSHIAKYCAIYLPDKHVVKMILEYAQLLSTAHYVLDINTTRKGLFRPTHVNHPCAKWVRESDKNYRWLYNLLVYVLQEYTLRYNKTHKVYDMLPYLIKLPQNIPITSYRTPFVQAMPDQYKVKGDAVQAYRNYFIHSKSHLGKWKYPRTKPWWWNDINA